MTLSVQLDQEQKNPSGSIKPTRVKELSNRSQ